MAVTAKQRKSKPLVYLTETNPLALEFLLDLLSRTRIEVIVAGKKADRFPTKRKEPCRIVSVIDRGALGKPLQRHLGMLAARFPDAKKLVLDNEASENELCSLLNQGVDGFVPYGQTRATLAPAIMSVAEGHVWVSPRVLEAYVSYVQTLSRSKRTSADRLSPRETEILKLMQQRFSNKEISSALSVSESTVKFHIMRIFQKLGIHSRYEILDAHKLPGEQ